MIEMFKYLTGILEGGERKRCGIIAVFGLLSPIMDLFNFTVIIYIINRAAQETGIAANRALHGHYGNYIHSERLF